MSANGSNRGFVIASVMASMAMIAMEATIVSTAMPQIAGQLGDLNLYSWVFSSFLLAQTTMTVIFGKLSDLYGRKPILMIGIAIFLVGSVLAGFATSMPAMILFRLLQGIGAGAVQPVAMTVVADLYPARERGKVQGYLASVWAISAVVGPIAGSLIVHVLSWSWIFWINVPVGILAAAGFVVFLKEKVEKRVETIDFLGAGLFAATIGALMIGLTEIDGGSELRILGAFAIFLTAFIVFLWHESRTPHPMVSLPLWRKRPIAAANAATLLSGMSVMGLTTFLPIYVQLVLQRSAVEAGLALTMLLVGWPVAATLASRTFHRFGIRRLMIVGSVLAPAGASLFLFLDASSSPLIAALGSLVMGFGMGLMSITALILIQEIVDWKERGSATASNVFSRNLGSTLGAAVLGAVLNYKLKYSSGSGTVTPDQLRALLNGVDVPQVAGASTRAVLETSLHSTFFAMFVVTALIVVACSSLPSISIGREAQAPGVHGH